MVVIRKGALALIFISLILGCASHKHYRAYLVSGERAGQSYEYTTVRSNQLSVTATPEQVISVDLKEIRVGFVHRDTRFVRWSWNLSDFEVAEDRAHFGLGSREFWLVIKGRKLQPGDPLELNRKEFVRVTQVRLDQESFTFFPLSADEAPLLKEVADSDYRLEIALYEVDGVAWKRAIRQAADTDLVDTAWTALKGAWTTASNALVGSLLEIVDTKRKEPLFLEQLLLSADAELEMWGSFDLLVRRRPPDVYPQQYALFDVVKSYIDKDLDRKPDCEASKAGDLCNLNAPAWFLSGTRKEMQDLIGRAPSDVASYAGAFRRIHGMKAIKLESEDLTPEYLSQVFVKFEVNVR